MVRFLFYSALVLTILFELLAGVALIAGPGGVSDAGSGNQWSMHYGFAAVVIGSVPVWTWFYRFELPVLTMGLGILLTFHSVLVVSLALAGDQQAGMIMHSVLAVICLVVFSLRKQLLETATDE